MSKTLIHLIAGARPNFMKIAPLYHALCKEHDWAIVKIVHTGQHYDFKMSTSFFEDLQLPEPDYHLEVGSGSHAEQTARTMAEYEKVCETESPDLVVVVGDVNSTIACALVAKKLNLRLAHLEAGLRSGDREMPEEINRLATDAISDYLWTPSPDADENLQREGHSTDSVIRVGNIMLDAYEMIRPKLEENKLQGLGDYDIRNYGVVTLHRPSNVDDEQLLNSIVEQLSAVASDIDLVFVVHPRTSGRLEAFGLREKIDQTKGLFAIEPLGYIDFMTLIKDASLVITDSGGLQEETTYLGMPCMTVRTTTERPITIEQGTNRLIEPAMIANSVADVLSGNWPTGRRPDLWDGETASRIVAHLKSLDWS